MDVGDDEELEEFPEDEEVELVLDDDFDPGEPAEAEPVYNDPPRRRRPRGLIAAGLLGVEQALYGPRQNEIVMVADADGMPEPDFEVNLTPDPRDSTVILRKRRWRSSS